MSVSKTFHLPDRWVLAAKTLADGAKFRTLEAAQIPRVKLHIIGANVKYRP